MAEEEGWDSEEEEGMEVPELPACMQLFDSFEEVHDFLKDWSKRSGMGFYRRSSIKAVRDGELQLSRVVLHCDRGPARDPITAGCRQSSSRRHVDCRWNVTARALKSVN